MWNLKDGKPFNPEYPDRFLASVREQGIFDRLGKTKADTKVNEKNHVVDVTLTFGQHRLLPPRNQVEADAAIRFRCTCDAAFALTHPRTLLSQSRTIHSPKPAIFAESRVLSSRHA